MILSSTPSVPSIVIDLLFGPPLLIFPITCNFTVGGEMPIPTLPPSKNIPPLVFAHRLTPPSSKPLKNNFPPKLYSLFPGKRNPITGGNVIEPAGPSSFTCINTLPSLSFTINLSCAKVAVEHMKRKITKVKISFFIWILLEFG